MQERRSSIANALELRLSCINPSYHNPFILSHKYWKKGLSYHNIFYTVFNMAIQIELQGKIEEAGCPCHAQWNVCMAEIARIIDCYATVCDIRHFRNGLQNKRHTVWYIKKEQAVHHFYDTVCDIRHLKYSHRNTRHEVWNIKKVPSISCGHFSLANSCKTPWYTESL